MRQGHKKLVTAPCLANRFGGPVAFVLLGTSSFDFKHFHTRSSRYRAAAEDFPPHQFFSISFLQETSPAPYVRPARDLRAGAKPAAEHFRTGMGGEQAPRPAVMSVRVAELCMGGWAENKLGRHLIMVSLGSR